MAVTRGRIGQISIDATTLLKVVDATLTLESAEITVTAHDSGQFEDFLQGRKNGSIEVSCRHDETDAAQQALNAAHFAESTVAVIWVSRGLATTGAERFSATAFVTAQPLETPNDEENKIAYTLRLTGAITRDTVP